MPRYTYQAYDRDGALRSGAIEAQSRQSALEVLHRQGQFPLDVTEARVAATVPWWQREVFIGASMPLGDLGLFTRELATLIKAELPLDDTLRIVSMQPLMSARMRALAAAIYNAVREGSPLSGALSATGRFPEYYWRLVQAGEASGTLGSVLDELAVLVDRSIEVRRQIGSALLYPATLMIAAIAAVVVIVAVLLPTIVPLFKDAGAALPWTVQILVDTRDLVVEHWLLTLLLLGSVIAAAIIAGRDDRLRLARDRALLRTPLVGGLITDRETARFARTLSSLLHHGVPILDAVGITAGVLRNRVFAAAAVDAGQSLKEGGTLSSHLVESGLYTDLATRLVAVGEQTGQLDTMLMQVATIYEATLQRRLTRIMSLVTPLLTLLIGALVGGLILSVMSAILSVNELAFK